MVGYKFSKEELNRARSVDLGALLLELDSGRFYTDSCGYIRDYTNEKFKVDRDKNKYYMNTEMAYSAGNTIEYFAFIVELGFVKAVEMLLAYVSSKK